MQAPVIKPDLGIEPSRNSKIEPPRSVAKAAKPAEPVFKKRDRSRDLQNHASMIEEKQTVDQNVVAKSMSVPESWIFMNSRKATEVAIPSPCGA